MNRRSGLYIILAAVLFGCAMSTDSWDLGCVATICVVLCVEHERAILEERVKELEEIVNAGDKP